MLENGRNGTLSSSKLDFLIKTLCYYLAAIYILGFIVSALGLGSKMSYTLVQIVAAIVVITRLKPFSISAFKLAVIAQIYVAGYLLYFWNYDLSWDGNCYHNTIIHLLLSGWTIFEKADVAQNVKLMVEHYAKNAELLFTTFAAPFSLTDFGRIAKVAFVELTFFSAFLFSRRTIKLSVILSLIFALAAVLNPVLIGQLFTRHVDDIVYLAIASMVFSWLSGMEYLALLMYALCIGIKFNAAFFSTAVLFALILANRVLLKKNLSLSAKHLFVPALIFCMSLSFYIYNFVTKGHPLYPANREIVAEYTAPNSIKNYGALSKLFISYLSFPGGATLDSSEQVKPVFKRVVSGFKGYTNYELYPAGFKDCLSLASCQINGFGFFWPFLLLFSSVIILSALIRAVSRKRDFARDKTAFTLLFVAMVICLTVIVSPMGWWARFVPHFWLIPLLIAGILGRHSLKFSRVISATLLVLLLLNSVPILYFTAQNTGRMSRDFNGEIAKLKKVFAETEQSSAVVYVWFMQPAFDFADERIKAALKGSNLEVIRVKEKGELIELCRGKQSFFMFILGPSRIARFCLSEKPAEL